MYSLSGAEAEAKPHSVSHLLESRATEPVEHTQGSLSSPSRPDTCKYSTCCCHLDQRKEEWTVIPEPRHWVLALTLGTKRKENDYWGLLCGKNYASALQVSILIFTPILWNDSCYAHFTVEETGAQMGAMTSHLGITPRSVGGYFPILLLLVMCPRARLLTSLDWGFFIY